MDGLTMVPIADCDAMLHPTPKSCTTCMSQKRSMVKQLNHTGRSIDLLKIDCEGCEWQSLADIFDAIHAEEMKVDQLQIELHGGKKEMINNLFQKADTAGMRIMHKERNQWGCDG